jgi:hypothetical protein
MNLAPWRARALAVGVVAVGASPLLLVGAHARAAVDCQYYYAYAAGDGVVVDAAAKNAFPLTNEVDSEGPAAHALVNSGTSQAIAGAPYPGDTAYTAPGLGGVDPSVYPLTAKSQYPPNPHAQAGAGAVSLVADSAELSSKATASGGGTDVGGSGASAGSSKSTATASCGDDGIVAASTTDTGAIDVADTLRIGRLHSEAKAVLDATGHVTLTEAVQIDGLTVAGQTINVNENGLNAGGQNVPLPNPLADALKSQDITLAYVAPVKDPNGKGVTAPGLEISFPLPTDQAGVGSTPLIVTLTFGRAFGSVDGSFGTSSVDGGGSIGGGTNGGSTAGGTTGGSTGGGVPDLGSGGATTTVGAGGASQPVVAGSPSRPNLQTQALGLNLPQIDWQLLYLAVVVGAVAVIGGGLLIRHIAERLRWT